MFEQPIKNIDDILYKDADCATEPDYVAQTSWVLFLLVPKRGGRTSAHFYDASGECDVDIGHEISLNAEICAEKIGAEHGRSIGDALATRSDRGKRAGSVLVAERFLGTGRRKREETGNKGCKAAEKKVFQSREIYECLKYIRFCPLAQDFSQLQTTQAPNRLSKARRHTLCLTFGAPELRPM